MVAAGPGERVWAGARVWQGAWRCSLTQIAAGAMSAASTTWRFYVKGQTMLQRATAPICLMAGTSQTFPGRDSIYLKL